MADESSIDNYLLISLVEHKPVLWDKTMELYKNRVATQAAWKKLMIVLNPAFENGDEKTRQVYAKLVMQRWTHIRDNYNRSYKKIQDQKRSGKGAKIAKPYVYSKQLAFLQKVLQPNETVSTLVTENINTETENRDNDFPTSEGSEINLNTMENNDTVLRNATPKRLPKRPMNDTVNPVDSKMITFMDSCSHREPNVTNRHLSFFNGILPTLDNFDDDEVLEFQMGVLQLLKDIKSSRQNRQLSAVSDNSSDSLSCH